MVLREAREVANSLLQEERSKDAHTKTSTTIGDGQHYPATTQEAREHVSMFLQNSCRIGNHVHEIPTFDARELLLGRWLGKGGFSDVDELRGLLHFPKALSRTSGKTALALFAKERLTHADSGACGHDRDVPGPAELGYGSTDCSESTAQEEAGASERLSRSCTSPAGNEASRQFLAQNCLRDSGEARYAIKRLRKEIAKDPRQYPSGVMDLAVEALFLADLAHPNIIKLRGMATCDPFSSTGDDYFFLILDRLQETLNDRMKKWQERKRKLNTLIGRITDVGGRKKQLLLDERLAAAFDLSAAMAYLKQNRILHRDIKPENLGFDIVSLPLAFICVSETKYICLTFF